MSKFFLLIGIFIFVSCHQKRSTISIPFEEKTVAFDESMFVKDSTYTIGDVRRYGLHPNNRNSQDKFKDIIQLAEQGIKINFPKGYYPINMDFKGVSNIDLNFNEVVIGGSLTITEEEKVLSSYLKFSGELTVLDKVFIRNSNNIVFDSLRVCSDTLRNIHHKKNRGVSIYVGSNDIKFKNLEIYGTGGDRDEFYKYTAAALQIHGWNDNPERIVIDKLIIRNAGRTALYLTGKDHLFKKVIVKNYGFGEIEGMFGLDDASPGTEREFAGVWVNKCNDCTIDSLDISNNRSSIFSLKMGIGVYSKPTFILNLKRQNLAKKSPIEDDILTNVLVKHEY